MHECIVERGAARIGGIFLIWGFAAFGENEIVFRLIHLSICVDVRHIFPSSTVWQRSFVLSQHGMLLLTPNFICSYLKSKREKGKEEVTHSGEDNDVTRNVEKSAIIFWGKCNFPSNATASATIAVPQLARTTKYF